MKAAIVGLIFACIATASPAQSKFLMVKTTCPFPAYVSLKVTGPKNERDGVAAEYAWLRSDRPGWQVIRQSVGSDQGRIFDRMLIVKGGAKQTLCFDITDFFGKF